MFVPALETAGGPEGNRRSAIPHCHEMSLRRQEGPLGEALLVSWERRTSRASWCLSSWMELSLTQAWALLYLFLPPSPSANSLGPRFPLLLSPKFRWRALWVICLWVLRNEGYWGVPVVWLHKHPWMITVHQGTLDSEMKDCLCPQGAYGPGRPKNRDRKFPQNEVGNVRAKKRPLRPREPLASERWGVEVVFFSEAVECGAVFSKGYWTI